MKKILFAVIIAMTFSAGSVMAEVVAIADADQEQGQTQGQGQTAVSSQGQTQGQGQSQGHAVYFKDSFNGSAPIRNTPIPTAIQIGTRGGPAMFANPQVDRGPNFISMMTLIEVLNASAIAEQEFDDDDIAMTVQKLNAIPSEVLEDTKVEFSLVGKGGVYPEGFAPVAVLVFNTDEEVNSIVLATALSAKALNLNCNKVVFIKEGTTRELGSWGVGIGLSYNYASIGSQASDNGSVGAGGTGWSMGKAGYVSFPYLTAVIGR